MSTSKGNILKPRCKHLHHLLLQQMLKLLYLNLFKLLYLIDLLVLLVKIWNA